MKCEECGKEPFGVQSWLIPRPKPKDYIILCPECSKIKGSLNAIEEDYEA